MSLSLGIEQFNRAEFYACHDTLEALWMEAVEPDRTFYQGLLQVAVGLYHLHNRNWRGAVTLLGEGCGRLRRYQPDHLDIDVTQFLAVSRELLQDLQEVGATQVEAIAAALGTERSLPKIRHIQAPD